MTLLSVNVNKVATLRNSRGQDQPHLLSVVKDLIGFGAKGITVHPRPDERHIKYQDVYEISSFLNEWNSSTPGSHSKHIEFNIEGYPSETFLNLIHEIRPDQCTLVPDPPEALTSNAGWNCSQHQSFLKAVVEDLHSQGVRTSLFIEPSKWKDQELVSLLEIRPKRVELYTELYAKNFSTEKQQDSLTLYKKVGQQIYEQGIDINAGHDLNQKNLPTLIRTLPFIKEVSIGHALICEALYEGLEATIKNYNTLLAHDPS